MMRRILPFALAVALVGCDDAPAAPTAAVVQVSASPGAVVAACGTIVAFCAATVALTFRETAGISARVSSIRSDFVTSNGVTADTATYDAAKITSLAGTNQIAASGTLRVPSIGTQEQIGNLWSSDGGIGRAGTLVITIQLADDQGHTATASLNIPVS